MHLLQTIPWWMYLAALAIVKIGMQTLQDRIVPLKKLFVAPGLLILLNVHSFWEQSMPGPAIIGMWLVGMAIGSAGGWLATMRLQLEFDHRQGLVTLPGGWSTLLMLLAVLGGKVLVGYSMKTATGVADGSALVAGIFLLSGVCTGVMVGRVAAYLRQYAVSRAAA